MKQKIIRILLCTIILAVLSSCSSQQVATNNTFQKRKYRKGFHFNGFAQIKKKANSQKEVGNSDLAIEPKPATLLSISRSYGAKLRPQVRVENTLVFEAKSPIKEQSRTEDIRLKLVNKPILGLTNTITTEPMEFGLLKNVQSYLKKSSEKEMANPFALQAQGGLFWGIMAIVCIVIGGVYSLIPLLATAGLIILAVGGFFLFIWLLIKIAPTKTVTKTTYKYKGL